MTRTHLPTLELTVHPAAKYLPRMGEDSPEFAALVALTAEHGLLEPIRVNQYRVVMGLDQWEAAKRLGLAKVPVIEIGVDEIFACLAGSLTARQHYTRGQVAYLSYPLLGPMLDASKKRQLANLKVGTAANRENPESALSALSGKSRGEKGLTRQDMLDPIVEKFRAAKTAVDLAAVLGIGRRTFFQAQAIHKEFAGHPELRQRFEPLLLGQCEDGATHGLGGIIAGIAGHKATQGVTPIAQPELQLWRDRVEKMFDLRRFSTWEKTAPETRAAVAEIFADNVYKTLPPEITAAIDQAAARRLGVRPRLTVVEHAVSA